MILNEGSRFKGNLCLGLLATGTTEGRHKLRGSGIAIAAKFIRSGFEVIALNFIPA